MYRRNGRGRLLLLVFIALSIIIITLDFRQGDGGPLQSAKEISVAVVAPIQRGLTTIFRPVGNFFASIGELGSLRTDNARLKAQVEGMEQEVKRAEALEDDFAALTRLSKLDAPYTAGEQVFAQVIGLSPSNYRWARFIDKGTDDGVRKDMAVINSDGLVGKVISVTPGNALVLLLIDPKAAAGARIENRRDTGKIQGNGEDQGLSLELIGSNSEVFEADGVVTSGQDGVFPPGIPIGLVDQISGDIRRPDQQIIVQPWVDFTALDYVIVLLDSRVEVASERETK
ncbi:MAG: rod shape-determining protein MreC [Actinomycetota bacterium]|jgi:rod shape-determining protein MreC|nr:rod shape-determining protein MreC [Actinomycetota bacterium]